MRYNRVFAILPAVMCFAFAGLVLRGQTITMVDETSPTTAPSQAPTTAPTTAPSATPEAKALLDQVRDAYANLKTLDLEGTLTFDFDVAGRKENHHASFTGSFAAPNKFRHEMKDDLLLVSNGQTGYAYKPDQKQYVTLDVPKGRASSDELPPLVGMNLQQQDPSLLFALVKDVSELVLTPDVKSIAKGPDANINGVAHPTLDLDLDGQQIEMTLDPQTHLLSKLSMDVKNSLVKQGVPQANKALVTIEYSKSTPDAAVADSSFAWTPPADATKYKAPTDEQAGGADDSTAVNELVGKPAPQFALKDLEDKDVSLADQKGSVVVLDFWATWCPPCREGLPHLDQLNKEMSDKGVKVFAVNLREGKPTVSQFLKDQKLGLHVVLDQQGSVAQQYKVSGIPQTVVIGKDGKVAKVFVGFGPGSEQSLKTAVETALSGT